MGVPRRTTVYFEPHLYRALKTKAATADRAVSSVVNEAVEMALREDALDQETFRERAKEPSVPYTRVRRRLKRDGLL